MIDTHTVSLPRRPVDAEKLGYFRFGALADGVILTTEHGRWHHLPPHTFRDLLAGRVEPGHAEYDALAAKGFLRDQLALDDMAAAIRNRRGGENGVGRGERGVEHAIGEDEIEEAGAGDFDLRETRVGGEARGDLFGEGARIGLGGLGGGQRAVRLELREVGPVGDLDAAEGGVEAQVTITHRSGGPGRFRAEVGLTDDGGKVQAKGSATSGVIAVGGSEQVTVLVPVQGKITGSCELIGVTTA